MSETIHAEVRIKQRFAVNLKAAGSLAECAGQQHRFLISNLSATGARLHFETQSDVSAGMALELKIAIPGTVLTIPAAAQIMWVNRQHTAVSMGIRFRETLSETMVQQLVKKS